MTTLFLDKMNLRLQLLLFSMLFVFFPVYGQSHAKAYTQRTVSVPDTMYVTENIVVAPGESLTIPAGTVVLFTAHFNIEVQGRVIAQGTEEKPIYFTVADTTGFSNFTGERGSWGGITFNNTAQESDSSLFTHCNFSYTKALGDTVSKFGGVFNIRNFSKIRIQHCTFNHNFAWHSGGAIYGEHADILIKNSTFVHNSCGQVDPPYGYGGAVCFIHSAPDILNCSFVSNSSTGFGGAAVFEESDVYLGANLFLNNHSGFGGAIGYLRSETSKPIVNNVFVGNRSAFFGEAIACKRANPTFLHNTLVDNSKNSHGGIFYCGDSSMPVIVNSILYNTAGVNNIEVYMWDNLSKPLFINCNIRGGKEAFGGTGASDYHEPYTGNIDQDPQLIHTEEYYGLLTKSSPCIDAGTTQLDNPNYPAFDFRGFTRISGPAPDMGAYEYESDLGIHNTNHSTRLLCYPNPFKAYIKITIPEYGKETSLHIYDINGRLVFATTSTQDYIWDGRDLKGDAVKEGIYVVKSYSIGKEHSTLILRGL